MAGYNGTSTSLLNFAAGSQNLVTQAALGYIVGEQVLISYVLNPAQYMSGTITAYNPVTGAMTVNITFVSGFFGAGPWNTQLWGATGGSETLWNLSLIGGVSTANVPVTPTIIVRALDANWDPMRGNGLANFLQDAAAVAQIIAQRLKLFQNEWFENLNLGLPLFQQILGKGSTSQAVALLIRRQILAVPYVSSIAAFDIAYNPAGREYAFRATVMSAFGPITVTNITPNQN